MSFSKISGIIQRIVLWLTILNGVLMTMGGAALYVHPRSSVMFQFLGLAFPVFFVINIVFLFYWWFQMKFKLVIPLCFFIFNMYHASKYIQFTRARKSQGDALHVGSLNAKLFGFYQGNSFFDTVVSTAREKKFDVFCVQEVYARKDLEIYLQSLRKNGEFRMFSFYRLSPKRPYGMAIFSRYRIINSGKIEFAGRTGNMAIFADILYNKDTVRIYNFHLQSIRFNKSQYQFIRDEDAEADRLEGSKSLLKQMSAAYVQRAGQADTLAAHMGRCQYKMMVCGDMNDVPMSYAYKKISGNLLDAYREAGDGIEKTYTGPFPSFRIDYIFHSRAFNCVGYRSDAKIPSDHKLIEGNFELKTTN